jgi:lysophospholipase L1-like esterase
MDNNQMTVVFVAVSVVVTVAFGFVFNRYRKTKSSQAKRVAQILSSVLCLFYLITVLEVIFANFVTQSDSWLFTLAAQRWAEKYYKPVNALGYRDYQHKFDGKKVLLVVGDSYVVGAGVRDAEDRFTAHIQRALGSDWVVANAARGGWDSAHQIGALKEYPAKPDRLIVSFSINDIEGAANAAGHVLPEMITPPPAVIRPLVDRSHVFNWLYWRTNRVAGWENVYYPWLKAAYDDSDAWRLMQAALNEFIRTADRMEAPLTFLLWPDLVDIPGTDAFLDKVESHLTEQGADVVNLADALRDTPPRKMIVNAMDTHPNPATHARVGQLLLDHIGDFDAVKD